MRFKLSMYATYVQSPINIIYLPTQKFYLYILLSYCLILGDKAFTFTALLHTYLGVEDVTKTTVSNLKGLEYVDKVR